MSRWWRAHDDSLDNRKVQRLPDDMFKAWYNLCCVSSKNDGRPFDIDEVVFRLRVSPARATKIVTYLIDKKLLDVVDGRYLSHDWDAHQFKSDATDATAADRMRRYRKNRNPVTENAVTQTVTVTPPRAETEQKDAADAAPDPEKELFARGKEVLGNDAGGLIAKLLKAKNKNVVLAKAVIDTASQKQDPREYVSAVIRGPKNGEFKLMSGREGII